MSKLHQPIFLYLKTSAPDSAALKKLNIAGYLTIGVNSFDDVKIIESIPTASVDAISRAALETILADTSPYGPLPRFGHKVASILAKAKETAA